MTLYLSMMFFAFGCTRPKADESQEVHSKATVGMGEEYDQEFVFLMTSYSNQDKFLLWENNFMEVHFGGERADSIGIISQQKTFSHTQQELPAEDGKAKMLLNLRCCPQEMPANFRDTLTFTFWKSGRVHGTRNWPVRWLQLPRPMAQMGTAQAGKVEKEDLLVADSLICTYDEHMEAYSGEFWEIVSFRIFFSHFPEMDFPSNSNRLTPEQKRRLALAPEGSVVLVEDIAAVNKFGRRDTLESLFYMLE